MATAAKKAAENQADETKAVIESDPTSGGANAEAGLTTAGVGDDAVLVKDGETPSGFYEDSGQETYVTVTKDVVEEFYYPGTKRPAYRVRFTKGQIVPKAVIDQLEADAKAREADPNALENYIDSTTYAAGTGATPSAPQE